MDFRSEDLFTSKSEDFEAVHWEMKRKGREGGWR